MKTKYFVIMAACFLCLLDACNGDERFEINSDDNVPPNPPVVRDVKPLYGGARIFYDIPSDKDLLSINAEFVAVNGNLFTFAASYYIDSMDIYGLGDTVSHIIKLYALDRAGNKSTKVDVPVIPLESAVSRVAKTLTVKPGFGSFYVDWINELQQTINIYVDFEFTQNGTHRELISVFSSNLLTERKFINDLTLSSDEPVTVKIRVEDIYGNMTAPVDFGQLYLHQDTQIPKESWVLPKTNDSIAGVPMCYGNGFDGRSYRVIDGEIDMAESSNYMHTGGIGRTGSAATTGSNTVENPGPNLPWNLIVDLGDYYELSRIVTHQRHSGGANSLGRGQYYQDENVGIYNMYILDEELNEWIFLTEVKIPIPTGLNDLEIVKLGDAGDMAYMYPDDPRFTQPARWFRYEAIRGFASNYTSTNTNCLSEITLFGRKANR
ncbi:MAG: DUF4959 domain-containing protein [Prevotellaceae bacterium]|nr:DUF4959 domain-containing protein [Prevotellaceae bacterium]